MEIPSYRKTEKVDRGKESEREREGEIDIEK